MKDIREQTKIPATCGIGSNLYLAKIALDITAKHAKDHIGVLTEESYRKTLWNHRPITDFWRVGPGIANRLERCGIHTMGEVARAPEELLYGLFGVDAELLIDHAWGRETTTIADIKAFKPKNNCLTSGQVLGCGYKAAEGELIVKEMADLMCLDLVDKGLVTESVSLYLSYEKSQGLESSRGTINMGKATSSAKMILPYVAQLYREIVKTQGIIHRVHVTFNHVVDETYLQYDLFSDPVELEKERKMQKAMLELKKKFGKNSVLKGMNLSEGAKTMERNQQIGGHRSGIEDGQNKGGRI